MQIQASQRGHDAPITSRGEDFYDRWPVATSISRIIATAPAQWSTRIGLFGPWGDGKTSVLNFLEHQQRDVGNIVIRYAPWGASTPDEVWTDFGTVLIDGLKKNGVSTAPWTRFMHFCKRIGSSNIKSGLKAAGTAVESTGYAPGASIGAEFASNLISKKLTFTGKDIELLTTQLGKRRVVVFIDDLDRTDPSVVPKLLLALRELLDFAQFVFVLAFDRRIVAAALEEHNNAWDKSGENFLTKVIDFPVELPPAEFDQVRRLAVDQFGLLCPFVPEKAIKEVAKLLPYNPRKLKLLARIIASMRDEVARHEAHELDWGVILLIALVRGESETFAAHLLSKTIDDGLDWSRWAVNQDDREQQDKDELERLLVDYPELKTRRERVERLVNAWRERMPLLPGERIRYQAKFALSPHCITWGEFKEFLATWRLCKRADALEHFVKDRVRASEHRRSTVDRELLDTICNHYSTLLERASEVQVRSDHLALMEEASDVLDLLVQCLTTENAVCKIPVDVYVLNWKHFHEIALQWRHFTSNEKESELRQKEVATLLELGKSMADPLAAYDLLQISRSHDDFLDKRQGQLKNEMTEKLRLEFEPKAKDAALAYLAVTGEIMKLRSSDESPGARYLLTSPRSPMFSTYKNELMIVLNERIDTSKAVEDGTEYLNFLLSALDNGDGAYCSADERKVFIRQHSDLMSSLWRLCMSQPSQFRMLQSLRKRRDVMLEVGMAEELLMEPDWLKASPA